MARSGKIVAVFSAVLFGCGGGGSTPASPTAPSITAQPQNETVAAGAAATFSVTAAGSDPLSYQWSRAGAAISGATSASYTTPATVAGDNGATFTVTVSNSAGSVTSNAATLTVTSGSGNNVAPTITAQPAGATVNAGQSATFTVTATGTPAPTYQWRKGGGSISGANGSTLTIASAQPSDAGDYTVVVSNSAGSVTSNAATLVVRFKPVITTQPGSVNLAAGDFAQFSVVASAVPAPTYQWRRNGTNLGGATASSYTTPAATVSDNGATFDCIVTNSLGSTDSDVATLSVSGGANHAVSGSVTNSTTGQPAQGINVSINTATPLTVITDSGGNFSFGNLPDGTYTVTPSLGSDAFTPASRSVTVSGADVTGVTFTVALGAGVTGTVTYSGSKTGRIYLALVGDGGTYGTNLASPGAFSIRGVQPGTYGLLARMDVFGLGRSNASDPSGSIASIVVGNTGASGQSVAMTDPSPSLTGVAGPANFVVSPFNGGAFFSWTPLASALGDAADFYEIDYSTSSTFASGVSSSYARADEDGKYFLSGLGDGSVLYFRVFGCIGTAPSCTTKTNASATAGPITIGARSGGHSVSGSVSFGVSATGPLYLGLFDPQTNTVYGDRIGSPSSPQSFTVTGVPDGTYYLVADLDQGNSGILDVGSLTNATGSTPPSVTVAGSNLTGKSLALSSAHTTNLLVTGHFQSGGSGDDYDVQMSIRPDTKLPVAATLIAAPNTVTPVDLISEAGSFSWFASNTARPQLNDTYTFSVTYSDGSTETVNQVVSTVLDAFATNLSPSGTVASGSLTPTFSWSAPASPPASYGYSVQIFQSGGGLLWEYPSQQSNSLLPSSTTTLVYDLDGAASQAQLTQGVTYLWNVTVQDSAGDLAQETVIYTLN